MGIHFKFCYHFVKILKKPCGHFGLLRKIHPTVPMYADGWIFLKLRGAEP